jgi:hypothetical protein
MQTSWILKDSKHTHFRWRECGNLPQAEIHDAVQKQSELFNNRNNQSCSASSTTAATVPFLYPLLPNEFAAANPTLVPTQLCAMFVHQTVTV